MCALDLLFATIIFIAIVALVDSTTGNLWATGESGDFSTSAFFEAFAIVLLILFLTSIALFAAGSWRLGTPIMGLHRNTMAPVVAARIAIAFGVVATAASFLLLFLGFDEEWHYGLLYAAWLCMWINIGLMGRVASRIARRIPKKDVADRLRGFQLDAVLWIGGPALSMVQSFVLPSALRTLIGVSGGIMTIVAIVRLGGFGIWGNFRDALRADLEDSTDE